MEANYVHKDSTTLVQDKLIKNELNQIELQYNALKQQKFNELLKENQELKLELSGYRQAILNNKEMLGLKEQNDKLKEKVKKLSQWDINKDTRNSRQRVANAKLLKENQELKKHLKVPKAYNLKTLEDYKSYYEDITREQILEDTYIEYCAYVNLAHRYSELKKQLENTITSYTEEHNLRHNSDLKLDVLETQQKEFINYLGDEIKLYKNDIQNFIKDYNVYFSLINDLRVSKAKIEEILKKYKSIIGDEDENKRN